MSNIPLGYCQCGCGNKTSIAKHSDERYGSIKGQSYRFVHGHYGRSIPKEQRFWNKVNKNTEEKCWKWVGAITSSGYGNIWFDGKSSQAHRVSWQIHFGFIPAELCVLHKCDNKWCVNPYHLFLGTYADNAADRDSKGRNGHLTQPEKFLNKSNIKLSPEKVRFIRNNRSLFTKREMAKMFGASISTINAVIYHANWRTVD